ncbi:MAG: helix-turn-helix domain-containing protein [Myxococcota bacterium]
MTAPLETPDRIAQATIPMRMVLEMLHGAPATERTSILETAGIAAAELTSSTARVSPLQFERLHHARVRQLDDEVYGFLPRRIPRGFFAALTRSATAWWSLRAVLTTMIELYAVFADGPLWRLEENKGQVVLHFLPRTQRQEDSVLLTFTLLLAPLRVAAWLGQTAVVPEVLWLDQRFRDFLGEARLLFGVAPRLSRHPSAVALPGGLLELPVRRTPEEVESWVRGRSLRSLLSDPPPSALESQVRLAVAEDPSLQRGLGEVAHALGLSQATLTRQLRASGTHFRQIRDALRRDRAVNLLAAGASVAEAAEALGFSEPSAFQRAFKAWTGSTPGAVRRRSETS